jgi:hypothetical protein
MSYLNKREDTMLHIIRLIRRHHPEHADTIVTALAVLSGLGLLIGAIALML